MVPEANQFTLGKTEKMLESRFLLKEVATTETHVVLNCYWRILNPPAFFGEVASRSRPWTIAIS